MDNATRLERLRLLRTVALDIPDDAPGFRMADWASHTGTEAPHLDGAGIGCGTACCMIGYAALRPEFTALGLGLRRTVRGWTPTLDRLHLVSWQAPQALFGLTSEETARLFDAYTYLPEDGDPDGKWSSTDVRPSHVIARINALIAHYSREESQEREADATARSDGATPWPPSATPPTPETPPSRSSTAPSTARSAPPSTRGPTVPAI